MKIYLKGGKGIEKPVDFNGTEIKEGDILTFDCFDPFFSDKYYYVEISGILEENKSNTLVNRIKKKHEQINRGSKRDQSSSVVVTLFAKPTTVKETHK
ncbi:hypothetical protein [Chryseobacterium aquaticum]|uniref:Uncharacterized protein n=1 Tax=Chryseobacterium aquaticum subsp. greenlandense TaxID=345663 RepID=A0A101CD23_9FLAO|nr:hypothetical protein [Chryseobacterium aquaticum]KUJ54022.1 hypothetical protein AR686_17705 [Chryseobacterium aquaticum subsp. greenlandense]